MGLRQRATTSSPASALTVANATAPPVSANATRAGTGRTAPHRTRLRCNVCPSQHSVVHARRGETCVVPTRDPAHARAAILKGPKKRTHRHNGNSSRRTDRRLVPMHATQLLELLHQFGGWNFPGHVATMSANQVLCSSETERAVYFSRWGLTPSDFATHIPIAIPHTPPCTPRRACKS